MIKLITFDLDNTLWDVDPVVRAADARMQRWIDLHYPQLGQLHPNIDWRALISRLMQEHPARAHDMSWLRVAALRHVFLSVGVLAREAELAAENAFSVFWHARQEVSFYEGTREMLSALKQDFVLMSISNGNADIHHVGLAEFMQAHFSAISVGVAKPHPAIFEAALVTAGVKPEECLHIGDDPYLDVMAAQSLGMKTIWMNSQKIIWPDLAPATADAHDIPSLYAAIKLVVQAGRE